jgi:hypothetical protein
MEISLSYRLKKNFTLIFSNFFSLVDFILFIVKVYMPSTNHIKFGSSDITSATRGGFKVGVKGGADYGPTSDKGFYNGITPPVGGYTIYVNKASQGPSIHVAYDNTECIGMLLQMGATGSTIENVLAWADGQANMLIVTAELTLGDLPGAGPSYYTYSWSLWGTPVTAYSADATLVVGSIMYSDSGLTTLLNSGAVAFFSDGSHTYIVSFDTSQIINIT